MQSGLILPSVNNEDEIKQIAAFTGDHMKKHMFIIGLSILVSMSWTQLAKADLQPASSPDPVAVIREAANGLPTHTIFRPADLSAYGERELPVVIWNNGGCRKSHYGYIGYLTGLAQGGYLVVAVGGINETDIQTGTANPANSIAAMDWLNSDAARKQFKGRLDASRIATAGTSCGGLEALLAAVDSRVDAVLALSTGFFPGAANFPGVELEHIDDVSVPVLLAYGGPSDMAADNAVANYERSDAPFILVTATGAGHNGLTYGLLDDQPDMGVLIESINLGTTWLDYALKGDDTAGEKLLAEDCDYCQRELFTVENKNF